MSSSINVVMACKLMPYYRLGVFQKLTAIDEDIEFTFFGDTKVQGGIKQIPFDYATASNGESIRWKKTKNYFYKPERLLWQTGIVKEILKSKYKVFVYEGAIAHYPIWWFAFLCKLRGKKVLYWTHGNRGDDRGVKKVLRKILFKYLGDGLLLYGNYQRNNMIADGYNPDRLFVIYNSLQPEKQFQLLSKLDANQLKITKQRLFSNPDNYTLIFIGRLVSHKGVMQILDMINSFKNEQVLLNCIFIGDGPEKDKMIDFCTKNALEKQIYFTGALYEEEAIAPYFVMADLMVSPGNVGLNCIHSLAYGVPVLTHSNFTYQNPEVEAIVNGETGVFFEYENMQDMKINLSSWMEKKRNTTEIQLKCHKMINDLYNPDFQSRCIEKAIKTICNDL
tara:strand:- start:5370 stop:6545 length:1176 start_codon:yes stop_codon:yes gene_type:complete